MRRLAPWRAVWVYGGLLACGADLEVPPAGRISCERQGHCPDGWRCDVGLRRCVRASGDDVAGPQVRAATLEPGFAAAGATVTLRLTVDEMLAAPPVVEFTGAAESRRFSVVPPFDDTRTTFDLTYDVQGSGVEREGPALLEVDLVDPLGNRARGPLEQSLLFDFTPPSLDGVTVVSPTSVELLFSEDMEAASLANPAAYRLEPALEMLEASVSGSRSVALRTAAHQPAADYTLTVVGPKDRAGNLVPVSATARFVGAGTLPDTSPPELLQPDDGERFRRRVTLVWAGRFGAASYLVEVARDPAFTEPVTLPDPVVLAPATTYDVELPAGTHFWRVSADVTQASSALAVRRVEILDDAVFVYCDATAACAADSGGGTLTNPIGTIADGLRLAQSLGISEVRVAGRGGGAAYDESLLVPAGLRLVGGYSPEFAERDAAAHLTVIESTGAFVAHLAGARDATSSVLLEGLTLRASPGALYGLLISDSNRHLTVRDCVIEGAGGTTSVGVYAVSSGEGAGEGPLLENVVVRAGDADEDSAAVVNEASALSLDGCTIAAGRSARGTSYGVQVLYAGEVEIVGSQVTSAGGADSHAVWAEGYVRVVDSTLTSGDAAVTSSALRAGAASVVGSTLVAGNATTRRAVQLLATGPHQVVGSTLDATNGLEVVAGPSAVEGNEIRGYVRLDTTRDGTLFRRNEVLTGGTVGVDLSGSAPTERARVDGNLIRGTAPTALRSLLSNALLTNNVIVSGPAAVVSTAVHGGREGSARSDSLVLVNNTLVVGPGVGRGRGVVMCGGADGDVSVWVQRPRFVNNLFVMLPSGSSVRIAIDEACDGAAAYSYSHPQPQELRHNAILVALGPMSADVDHCYRDVAVPNTLGQTVPAGSADNSLDDELTTLGVGGQPVCEGPIAGNLTWGSDAYPGGVTDLAAHFMDPDGTLTPEDPWDDWRPRPSNPVQGAGLNLYANPIYGDITADGLGAPRPSCGSPPCDGATSPWNIGAL